MKPKLFTPAALLLSTHIASAAPPVAPVHPVVTDYYGTNVTDNYRWMETPGSKPLAAYMKGQNDDTRHILNSMPGRAALLKDITADSNLTSSTEGMILANGRYFYLQAAPGQNTAKLYMRDATTGATTLLADPDTFGAKGQAEAINFFQPSWDGKYVAYGVSAGGSEAATLRVIDTATGKDQGVAITRVDGDNFEFLPVWWLADDSFAYYRLQKLGPQDAPTEYFLKSRVWLHHLGQDPSGDDDTPVFGYNTFKSVPVAPDQDALVMSFPGSNYAFGVLTENESNNVIDAIYATPMAALETGKPVWTPVAQKSDDVTQFDAAGNKLYFLTYHGAPRYKVIETDLTAPDLATARTVVPEGTDVIRSIAVAKNGLYVVSSDGGFSNVRWLPAGAPVTVKLPYPGTVATLATNETGDGAVFSLESWTRSALWFKVSPSGAVTDTGLQKPAAADTSDLVSEEVMAPSYDGTLVPLSIIMPKGTRLDGKNPTLLVGYGAYGITLTPFFSPRELAWFKRGGILAIAHVRGGGWYGEDWHKAGMKLTKLNTVFDFIACGQYLVDHHYTSPAHLAGEGGSAGGITIGGAITWRPDLFAAAIDSHGDTDSLRMEFTPNGPPNISEFGSVTTKAGFNGLYAMSAYVHVRDGVNYPAVLLETGANDPRVEPWAVTKMAARLQAATSSGKPVLLSVSYDSGHGIGDTKAQENADFADELSFILWRSGAAGFQPHG
jgi:prolyl oligopeptidase